MESHYATHVDHEQANNSHAFMVQLVGMGKKVLELGAASGYMSSVLKDRGNSVVAVEADASCAPELQSRADEVIIADLDWLTLVRDLRGRTFDVVIAGDVLEHTTKSDLILQQIRHLIAPNGYLVLTLPHVAHGDVRLTLLNGEFPYSDQGLLDKTHLRFFTRTAVRMLLEQNGYEVSEIYGTTTPLGTTELGVDLSQFPADVIQRVMDSPDSDVYQFVVKAIPREQGATNMDETNKVDSSSINEVEMLSEIASLRHRNRELQNSIIVLENRLASAESELRSRTVADLESRDYLVGLLAELGEHKGRNTVLEEKQQTLTDQLASEMTRAYTAEVKLASLEDLSQRNARLRSELTSVYASKPWKLGRAITSPFRLLKKMVR